jgi:agmatine/peptidylarginine deiminase
VFHIRIAAIAIILAAVAACNSGGEFGSMAHAASQPQQELIVLAAPLGDDPYYADPYDDVFDFHVAYAKAIAAHDDVLIFVDESAYDDYAAALGSEQVVVAPMLDIWMRDFSLSNAVRPVRFRYSAAGQGGGKGGQREADRVQRNFSAVAREAGLSFSDSALINDGGNFVDDYAGRAVVSRKFLRDNRLTEAKARSAIRRETGVDHVAFIDADEQGGLEHADGVVAFIAPNVLVVNSYPDDPDYAAKLRADLEAGLPGVTIHEIVTPYDGDDIYDEAFGSACGLYTNMLVTPERIYFPQFGIPEDAIALADLRRWSSKEIVPVNSSGVCRMGGGVRCMSWQLRGENAERLLDWAKDAHNKID